MPQAPPIAMELNVSVGLQVIVKGSQSFCGEYPIVPITTHSEEVGMFKQLVELVLGGLQSGWANMANSTTAGSGGFPAGQV